MAFHHRHSILPEDRGVPIVPYEKRRAWRAAIIRRAQYRRCAELTKDYNILVLFIKNNLKSR
jgi:hypothetical protein